MVDVVYICRYALRRRRSLQQKDEEGCVTSSMAATADEVFSLNFFSTQFFRFVIYVDEWVIVR